MLSFDFANKNSFSDFGIYIEKMPLIPSPQRRVSYISMPGRSSSLLFDEGVYEDITLAVSCGIKGNAADNIGKIKAWLFGSGESDLVFSFYPDRKYIAQVVNRIDFEVVLRKISRFVIIFNCRPFQYSLNNLPFTITSQNTNLINQGSIESEPIIEVYASGTVEILINEQKVSLENVPQKLIINSVLQEVYDESFNNQSILMQGDFPVLAVGDNNISWSGNVQKLVITPNTRWL